MSFFGLLLPEHELPLTLRLARKRRPALSDDSDLTVGTIGQRISHAWKLRKAKRYLYVRGIAPWTKWDHSNTTFRFRRKSTPG